MGNRAGAPRISRVGVLLLALKYVEGVELPKKLSLMKWSMSVPEAVAFGLQCSLWKEKVVFDLFGKSFVRVFGRK